jgi:hypothetical protein
MSATKKCKNTWFPNAFALFLKTGRPPLVGGRNLTNRAPVSAENTAAEDLALRHSIGQLLRRFDQSVPPDGAEKVPIPVAEPVGHLYIANGPPCCHRRLPPVTRLAAVDPQAAQLVELRHFTGLTVAQAAQALGISPRTADRLWAFARAWLHRELTGTAADPQS